MKNGRELQNKLVKKKEMILTYLKADNVYIRENPKYKTRVLKELDRIEERLKELSNQEFERR